MHIKDRKGNKMPDHKTKFFLYLCIMLIFLGVCRELYADSLDAKISRDNMPLGEMFTLTYTLNSTSSHARPDFSVLEQDFYIHSTNYGNAINMINGVTTKQTFWQLVLEPKTSGELLIAEIDFGGGIKSDAMKITVEKNHTTQQQKEESDVFVVAEISTMSPYVQSEVLYTFKLFYRTPLENPRIEVPKMSDTTFMTLNNDKNYQTTHKGKQYEVIEKSFVFFPQKSGKMNIPATHFRASTYDNNTNASINQFFMSTPKNISSETKSFNLNVKKIPDQYQASSWLPAKNVSISEEWSHDTKEWNSNDPYTRTITVLAEGLRADQIPDLPFSQISGVNIYSDPVKRSNIVKESSIVGKLIQKVTYLPNASSSFTIPEIKLNWWNTRDNKAAVAKLSALSINVKGKNITQSKLLSHDQTQHSSMNHSIAAKEIPFYSSIWFWISSFVVVIWLFTLFILFIMRRKIKLLMNLSRGNEDDNLLKRNHNVMKAAPLDEKHFVAACEQGNAPLAQQFLLSWAKNEWQEIPINLQTLRENVSDLIFKEALTRLEKALYASKNDSWDGLLLLQSFQSYKKTRHDHSFADKKNKNEKLIEEMLPPLNP